MLASQSPNKPYSAVAEKRCYQKFRKDPPKNRPLLPFIKLAQLQPLFLPKKINTDDRRFQDSFA